MAYDGLVVSASVLEFQKHLCGGKISKITQPEKDELLLQIKNQRETLRLKISVNPSLPLCLLTEDSKPAPITAPTFCMSLRKHIGNGTILSVRQPASNFQENGLERIIVFEIEHLDEMGDTGRRLLVVELMGKHSNIILLREDLTILDSIKHISASQSSVREVLPNRSYFIPDAGGKRNPLTLGPEDFSELIGSAPMPCYQAIYQHITGLSPVAASEICYRAKVDPDLSANCQTPEALHRLYAALADILQQVLTAARPEPNIIYEGERPLDFSAITLYSYIDNESHVAKHFDSMSQVIQTFYAEKDKSSRIKQKSTDLRKILTTLLERAAKKLSLQERQLKDTESKDKFRIYGELLNTYGYALTGGETSFTCENYYTGQEITIPLNKDLSAGENAKRFFEKYNKLKRTEENVTKQLEETRRELMHLESIKTSLDLAEGEEDLKDIRREMSDFGYIKRQSLKGKQRVTAKPEPYRFLSSDGYEIYVGRNNYQNEQVSFKIADGGDMWFHAKGVPGSHVIVKTRGEELPDQVYIEAAQLAAYFSSHREDPKVEVDYTQRKNLKKVPNAAPGFVIYHQNWSVTVEPKLL